MRDHLHFAVNGKPLRVDGQDAFLTLSEFLRRRCQLVGTKIVCSEGDCGSCTVLVGRRRNGKFVYHPVDSCIQLVSQVDGAHVVTVEGLSQNGNLTPVQQAMIDCHGSQCGFCTPGFVVAMTGLLERGTRLTDDEWRCGLTGNLCRCTGYSPIFTAADRVDPSSVQPLSDLYAERPWRAALAESAAESFCIQSEQGPGARRLFGPTTLDETVRILHDNSELQVVAGATDVGVQLNKRAIDPAGWLDLNRVDELTGIKIENNEIDVGARATWSDIEAVVKDRLPEFHAIVSVFGSPQIRHAGTLGGNIVNASPIADSLPFLMVSEAELELASVGGSRTVAITDFYTGYKEFDLRPGEILTRIRIPLPELNQRLRLYKVSRRRDLDIATFTAALMFAIDDQQIIQARVAFGAVGPTVMRATQTEQFLLGQMFSEDTMRAAGDVAVGEISPISDVRGTADYRRQLTRNVLRRFYHEQTLAKPVPI